METHAKDFASGLIGYQIVVDPATYFGDTADFMSLTCLQKIVKKFNL